MKIVIVAMICIAVTLASAHHCNHHKNSKRTSTPQPIPEGPTIGTGSEIPDPIENEAIPHGTEPATDDHPEFIDERFGNGELSKNIL